MAGYGFVDTEANHVLQPLHTLLRICWFQAGPQDLPYSHQWLAGLVVATGMLSFVSLSLLPDASGAMPTVVLHTALGLAAPWILLRVRNRPNRFVQTASATFGTSLLLTIAVLPALVALGTAPDEPVVWAAYYWLAVVIWSIAVLGHILRHALDVSAAIGVLLALLYYSASLFLNQLLG